MKVFTCTDHAYFWPVGVASVVIASEEDEARRILIEALAHHGLKTLEPFTLQELDATVPGARILADGNY